MAVTQRIRPLTWYERSSPNYRLGTDANRGQQPAALAKGRATKSRDGRAREGGGNEATQYGPVALDVAFAIL